MNKIRTIAVFDCETTGLPKFENFKTQITELSIIACTIDCVKNVSETSIKTIEDIDSVLRIKQKLTIPFKPTIPIKLEAQRITQLDNLLLEDQSTFNENAIELLNCFITSLPQPVCLIAHNGNNFDFPILQKSIKNYSTYFNHKLYCVDSIDIFRDIEEGKRDGETVKIPGYTLSNIYRTCSGNKVDPKNIHTSECDALMLLYCIIKKRESFLPLIDEYKKLFCNVKSLDEIYNNY